MSAASQKAYADAQVLELGPLGDPHHAPRRVVVRIPDAPVPRDGFPVLVVNDGQAAWSVFQVDRHHDALVARGQIDPHVIVAVDTTVSRRHEMAEHPARYANFLADVVLPCVSGAVRIASDRSKIAVLGYSYGGLAALWAGLSRGDVFGRVIAMSPSIWFGQRRVLAAWARAHGPMPVRLYLDVGAREGRAREEVPSMVRDARSLRDEAVRRGMVVGNDLRYFEEPGAVHDMFAAERRMEAALSFALSGPR